MPKPAAWYRTVDPNVPPPPAKVHSYDTERMAVCIKAKKVRYGRERLPAWAYLYDDGNGVVVLIEGE